MVTDKAEKDKKVNLKPGRYIRIESDTRIAKVNEEYDLLRKFSNFHYSSLVNADATSLKLIDKNDLQDLYGNNIIILLIILTIIT